MISSVAHVIANRRFAELIYVNRTTEPWGLYLPVDAVVAKDLNNIFGCRASADDASSAAAAPRYVTDLRVTCL